ncbi:MAG: PEP-CTERM sorting domain-containing protein [Phycisphaerales bacterium]
MNIINASIVVALAAGTAAAGGLELTTNGGFETGDTTGWEYFATPASTFAADGSDPFAGSFAGNLENLTDGSAAVIKQANIGIGLVNAGDEVTISFWAKNINGVGGVNFAEFFSEVDGGGTSSAEILGGAPLFASDTDWTFYEFTTFAGPDVSGGVTLQFTATTGAVIGSTSQLLIDDVSVSIVPAPASVALMGLGGLVAGRRRR